MVVANAFRSDVLVAKDESFLLRCLCFSTHSNYADFAKYSPETNFDFLNVFDVASSVKSPFILQK